MLPIVGYAIPDYMIEKFNQYKQTITSCLRPFYGYQTMSGYLYDREKGAALHQFIATLITVISQFNENAIIPYRTYNLRGEYASGNSTYTLYRYGLMGITNDMFNIVYNQLRNDSSFRALCSGITNDDISKLANFSGSSGTELNISKFALSNNTNLNIKVGICYFVYIINKILRISIPDFSTSNNWIANAEFTYYFYPTMIYYLFGIFSSGGQPIFNTGGDYFMKTIFNPNAIYNTYKQVPFPNSKPNNIQAFMDHNSYSYFPVMLAFPHIYKSWLDKLRSSSYSY